MERLTHQRHDSVVDTDNAWLKRAARVLLPLISLTITVQPAAYAAPSPSLLSQTPMFLDTSVQSNVMFLMDDSTSMNGTRLPVPTGLDPAEAAGGNVTTAGNVVVERVNEWIFRSSALNPLYYNPAITYRAWNDNGRAGASGAFLPASTAFTDHPNGFREGATPQDMRYVGPNYLSGASNFARLSTITGANPPSPPTGASGPTVDGGFSGARWDHDGNAATPDRNQDLFSTPLVFVTSATPVCTSGVTSVSTSPFPSQARGVEPRPTLASVTEPRPQLSRATEARNSTSVIYENRAGSGGVTLGTETRLNTPINSEPRPSTPVSTAPRPSTPLTYEPRPSAARTVQPTTTEWRIEVVPTCNGTTFTSWSITQPADNFCISGEGQTRPAVKESRQVCPSGWQQSGSTCLSPCGGSETAGTNGSTPVCWSNGCASSGFTLNGPIASATQCQSPCAGNIISGACYASTCADPTWVINGAVTSATTCSSPCTSADIISGRCYERTCASTGFSPSGSWATATTCTNNTCPGGNIIGGVCYGACPSAGSGWVINGSASTTTTCRAPCAGTLSGLNCYPTACTLSGGTCYSNTCTTSGYVIANATQCRSTSCPGGNIINSGGGDRCYTTCPSAGSGFTINGSSTTATTCIAPCGGSLIDGTCYANSCTTGGFGYNGPVSTATTCISSCDGTLISGTCYQNACSTTGYGYNGTVGSATTCIAPCSDPAFPTASGGNCVGPCLPSQVTSGSQCLSCPANNSFFNSNTQCCPNGNQTTGNCPIGQTCPTVNRWYFDPNRPAPARYFVFQPVALTRAPTGAELSNPANYVRIQLNRNAQLVSYPTPFVNNDPTQGRAVRTDCAAGNACTFAEEMQNFANWYAYYRTRLFAAIGVTAESLSGLNTNNNLDRLRLGYGSINYFPQGADPYAPPARLGASMTVDGEASVGAIVRGVRPFNEGTTARQEVFDWLFSLRGLGSTPNREAIDAVGRYFARDDNRGPWIEPTQANDWYQDPVINPEPHISCRRNNLILVTDGEWTRAVETVPPQQPLMESAGRPALPTAIAAQAAGTPRNAVQMDGPVITGMGIANGRTYQYRPSTEPQVAQVSGNPSDTLTDVALYWWSRDLRPDLPNNIRAVDSPAERRNEAFWQSLTPFIVGYGISASRETTGTRNAIANRQAVTWPNVAIEARNPGFETIVTDRDADPTNTSATVFNCAYNASSNPSGCGRVDDTFRAARAARGDFLTATDVTGLAAQIAAAFQAIGEIEGSGTAAAGRSSLLRAADQLFFANFVTNRWTGDLLAFDAVNWLTVTNANGTPVPQWRASSVLASRPPTNPRNILTSTAAAGSGVPFQWASISAAQQAALGNANTLNYVRGDQSLESPAGPLRRRFSLLGDIINSQPVYSKAADAGYGPGRLPAAGGGASYRAYVAAKANATTGRRANVMVGSNGGMLHGFDAANGNELFAYVPRAVYSRLPLLQSQVYTHRYFVDGPVVEGDAFWSSAWRTIAVGTNGAGPRGVFALDVTQPESVGAGSVLWDLTGADHPDLGHIMQPGFVASALDGQWYYFVGNGYESTNDKAVLLAINLQTGVVYPIATDSAGGPDPIAANVNDRPNGLGGITPVFDANRNVVEIYGGDRLGRMWKFDLNSATRANWKVATPGGAPLFVAVDPLGNRQPITAAPRLSVHPLGGRYVTFGTGRFFERADRQDQQVQAFYALWEKNPASPVAISKSQLRTLTLADTASGGQQFRQINGQAAINWTTDSGWYFDLRVGSNNNGERVLVSPIDALGYLNLTTYEPLADGDPCVGTGLSYFYRLDVASSFQRGAFAGQAPSIVGARTDPSIAPPNIMRQRSDAAAGTLRNPTSAQLRQALGSGSPASTDPCETGKGNAVTGAAANLPALACENLFVRTWRDLPRD